MKKAWMNISHSRFILFILKIFGEIVTTIFIFILCSYRTSNNFGLKLLLVVGYINFNVEWIWMT